jgi:prevent-host-death family protein
MPKRYSLYEAKSKLSQLVRQVREGGAAVTITLHGHPVAEIRALEPQPEVKSTAERRAELERAGLVHRVPTPPNQRPFPLGVRRPGALERFLEARD